MFVVLSDTVNTTIDGVAVTQTRFEPTKKMSSYLLAIVVSDYTCLTATQGDTLVTVITDSRSSLSCKVADGAETQTCFK